MATAGTLYSQFFADLSDGVHALATDQMSVALSNTAPDPAADRTLADIAEIFAGAGYAAGGLPATTTSFQASATQVALFLANVTFTASGGSIGPFQYVVLYNATPASQPLIGYWDVGAPVVLADLDIFETDFDQTLGALTIGG